MPRDSAPQRFGPLHCAWVAALSCVLLLSHTVSATEGALLLGDDPIRVGRAAAAVAGLGNASWMMFNPAGLDGLDRRVEFNLTTIHSRVTLHTKGIAEVPFRGEMEDTEWNAFSSFGLVLPREDGTLGLGIYIPAGAMVHFPHSRSWVGFFEGNNDRNIEFVQPRLILAYAHRFDSGWVFGGSVNGSLSLGRTDEITPRLLPTRGDFDWDCAFGAGFGLGVRRRWERWSFGAAFGSRQWSQVFDKYRDITARPADLPATFQTGVGFKLTPKLEVEVDYRFINWSNVKFFHQPSSGAGLGWQNQHAVMAGIEWSAAPRWTFRAGYAHVSRAMNDENLFGSALIPFVLTDHVGAGFTWAVGRRSELSVALAHFFRRSQAASGDGDLYGHLGRGSTNTAAIDWMTVTYCLKF